MNAPVKPMSDAFAGAPLADAAAWDASPAIREGLGLAGGSIEVHTLRRAMRARPNGRIDPELIISLTQRRGNRMGGATLARAPGLAGGW